MQPNNHGQVSDEKQQHQYKGVVLVFNYIFKKPHKHFREGADNDSAYICSLFQSLNYEVILEEDKTKVQTFNILQSVVQTKLKDKEAFLLFFMSHGNTQTGHSHFLTFDEETIHLPEIYEYISDSNCPHMRGKPKLLFLNYCRGEYIEKNRVEYDGVSNKSDPPHNLAIVHASLPGIKACRTKEGTLFISCLCDTIKKYRKKLDLNDLVYQTGTKMKSQKATTPTIQTIQFRKFYF